MDENEHDPHGEFCAGCLKLENIELKRLVEELRAKLKAAPNVEQIQPGEDWR